MGGPWGSPLLSRPLMSGNKAARHAFECRARVFSCPQPERADLPRFRLRPRAAFCVQPSIQARNKHSRPLGSRRVSDPSLAEDLVVPGNYRRPVAFKMQVRMEERYA